MQIVCVQLMPLHPQTPPSLASFKSRLVIPLWCSLAQVVLEKRPLNWCTSCDLPLRNYRATQDKGGSVAEWLACWTQAQKARVQIAVATLSGNSLRQTVHTHRASVHQAAKLVAALLRVAGVSAVLAESNGSLPPGL